MNEFLPINWGRSCAAVIPCLNEGTHIFRVVSGVRRHVSQVIVVDDGSSDATAENARAAGAEVICLLANLGKGAALRRGWEHARECGCDWVLMLDGDGQHASDDIPRFFARADETGAALVIGNRMNNPGPMPFSRRCANRWMSRWISRMTGAEVPDSQCGFRLAHLETLASLPIRAHRFEIESAMLVAFLTAGKKVEFTAIQTIYETGASKIRPVADTWRWLRWRLSQRAAHTNKLPIRAS